MGHDSMGTLIRASHFLDRGALSWEPLARSSGAHCRASGERLKNRMDVLSEVLKVVKLEGALYYNAEFTAPWSFRAPPSSVLAPHFSSGGGHVIIYHLLTEGQGFAGLEHSKRVPLIAGDIVIFPHGDPHIIGNGADVEPVNQERELHRIFDQGLKLARAGGGGEVTKFVCGYMSCDPQLSRVFLAGLPAILKVNVRNDAPGRWLENSILWCSKIRI